MWLIRISRNRVRLNRVRFLADIGSGNLLSEPNQIWLVRRMCQITIWESGTMVGSFLNPPAEDPLRRVFCFKYNFSKATPASKRPFLLALLTEVAKVRYNYRQFLNPYGQAHFHRFTVLRPTSVGLQPKFLILR